MGTGVDLGEITRDRKGGRRNRVAGPQRRRAEQVPAAFAGALVALGMTRPPRLGCGKRKPHRVHGARFVGPGLVRTAAQKWQAAGQEARLGMRTTFGFGVERCQKPSSTRSEARKVTSSGRPKPSLNRCSSSSW